MSDFLSHARNNAKFNQEQLYPGQANPRAAQLNTRNASTFNPIAFNPEANAFVDDEKQRKKDKQRQYRDQLDQMVHGTSTKVSSGKTTADIPQHQYQNQYEAQFDPVREKRDLEHRYMQANVEKQQTIDAPYGNDYGRYPAPQQSYDNASSGTYARRGESPVQTQSRKLSQREPVIVDRNEPASTFNQQDELRDQLLAKIRSGNKQPNNYVYGTYQNAHEERERSRREFERNVIDKAAQEKLYKEDQRASSQWEQKKKLERDTYIANQQAIQAKSQQKQRSQQAERVADQGRIKDSLEQFERQDLDSKYRKMKLMEENSKVLQQQRYDYQSRKQGDDQDIRTSGHYSQADLSPNKVPSNQYPSYGGGYQGESQREQQRAPLVSRPGADNWQQGELASKMDNLNVKEQYGGYPSYPQEDYSQKYDQGAQGYARQDDYAQKYYQEQPAYQPKDDYGYEAKGQAQSQEPKHNPTVGENAGAKSDYMRIRDKVRYGNSYNIISNELR